MWDKMQQWLSKLLGLGFVWKFVATSLAGALGGSGYIALVSKYANFYYAWTHGFRIPAEGSPYIEATIGAISFISILIGMTVFLGIYLLGQYIWFHIMLSEGSDEAEGMTLKLLRMEIEKLDLKSASIFIVGLAFVFGVLAGLIGYYVHAAEANLFKIFGVAAFIAAIFGLVMWRRRFLNIAAALIATLFALISPFPLFNDAIYSMFLRELRYGGGLPVTLSVVEENKPKSVDAVLYLRTNTSLFVSIGPESKTEFLLGQIKSIHYKAVTLNPGP